MSKKSFAVGTGAMDLRPLLTDIMGGFRFGKDKRCKIMYYAEPIKLQFSMKQVRQRLLPSR